MPAAPTRKVGARTRKDLGPLHEKLIDSCPADESGHRSIHLLADALEVSPQALYKAIKKGRITERLARAASRVSGGRVPFSDFALYISR